MIVGTAGHIDHGKTSLVRALTGIETDRLKEEKRRGITIDLGFAYRDLGSGETVGFVDVPGHERFVHTMLAGASGIDFALLVVAADDGVMPQTREHLAILDLLGLSRGLVALTKCDLVDEDRREAARAEIAVHLDGTTLEGTEILSVSSQTGEGIEDLRSTLAAAALETRDTREEGLFRLAVDRSFVLPGAGTVVTGTVLSGSVRIGDAVTISPSGLSARVRSIHAQDRKSEVGVAGDRCALNLAGEAIERGAIKRGDMVLDPVLHAPTARIDAELRVLASETRPIEAWFPVRLHHGATEVGARIVPLGDRPLAPGADAQVQIVLEAPIAAAAGDRFVIRDTSARRTVGGGRFLDLRAPARRRRTPERLALLAALGARTPAERLSGLLRKPPFHVDLSAFARDQALHEAPTGTDALLHLPSDTGPIAFLAARWALLRRDLLEELGRFHSENPDHPGMGIERLRLALATRLPAPVLREALQAFSRSGDLALDGGWVRLAGFEAKLSEADERLWHRIEPTLTGEARFRPPRTRDFATELGVPEPEMRRTLKSVGRMGLVHEIAPDHFFRRTVLAEIVAILREVGAAVPSGEFTAADLRDRLENGRKVAIQILEFFDHHGLTLRRGDMRRLNPHRLDLFG